VPKKHFSIHSDFYDALSDLTATQRGDILLDLINRATDTEPDTGKADPADPVCASILRMMTAKTARISQLRSEYGKMGGRGNKKAKKATESNGEQINASDTASVSVPASDTETDSFPNNISLLKASDKMNKANKTYGTHKLIVLSDKCFNSLIEKHGKNAVESGIAALDHYAVGLRKKGKLNISDWEDTLAKAIEESWDAPKAKQRNTPKKRDYSTPLF
jgi:hypothetical protein